MRSDIDFAYQTSGQNYLDARNTMLHVQCKVVKADGTSIGNTSNPKGYAGYKFFALSIRNRTSQLWQSQPRVRQQLSFMAYLENLLNSGEGSKRSTDQAHMWIHDDTGVIDTE